LVKKHKIIVIVEGGLIQDISNIPKDIEIEVHDYDCDSEPDPNNKHNNTREDSDGAYYWQSTWE